MAKNKRATALFEVMSKAKLPNGKPGSGIPTPKWWFRSTNRSEVRTLAPGQSTAGLVAPPAAAEPAPAPSSRVEEIRDESPADDPTDNDPTQVDPATLRMSRADRERQRERERATAAHSLASSLDVPETSPTAPGPRVQPVEVSVDPKTQQISLRLSYTSALIGGFAFLILIALAILIGKTLSRGPSPAIANTDTKTLRASPPTPGVIQVQRRTIEQPTARNDPPIDTAGQGARPVPGGSTGTRNPQPQRPAYVDPQPPATFFTDDPKRTQGLNYAIVQSFPNKESAQKAADFLTTHGVPCTIERDLPRWPLPWKEGCAVVGIRGFAKTKDNAELEAYKKTIGDLGVKFAGGKARFNAFDPRMYQWDKAN
jgi:hypothetical protein